MTNDANLARMILDQRDEVKVNQIAKQSLQRDSSRAFGKPYDVVLRCSNRALRAIERGEQPDETDASMMVWIAERAKFFESISKQLGVTIEV